MLKHIKPALLLFVFMTLLTGAIYPLAVTGIAQVIFPSQANGSLLMENGKAQGSELIGQAFTKSEYFWSRPSATVPVAYNAAASSGSNLGPTNPALVAAVKARMALLQAADPDNKTPIPVELLTASASGLDPHISPAAADYQIHRVAKARHMDATQLGALVLAHTQGRQWGILGEPRVNVLALNLALDALRN